MNSGTRECPRGISLLLGAHQPLIRWFWEEDIEVVVHGRELQVFETKLLVLISCHCWWNKKSMPLQLPGFKIAQEMDFLENGKLTQLSTGKTRNFGGMRGSQSTWRQMKGGSLSCCVLPASPLSFFHLFLWENADRTKRLISNNFCGFVSLSGWIL